MGCAWFGIEERDAVGDLEVIYIQDERNNACLLAAGKVAAQRKGGKNC